MSDAGHGKDKIQKHSETQGEHKSITVAGIHGPAKTAEAKHQAADTHVQAKEAQKKLDLPPAPYPAPPMRQVLKSEDISLPNGKRHIERDKQGKLTKITEPNGSYIEITEDGATMHKANGHQVADGRVTVDPKTKDVVFNDYESRKSTTLKADGSRVERELVHTIGVFHKVGRITEIQAPFHKDGSPGDTRHFTYDKGGKMIGYSVESQNKDHCSHWKAAGDGHWRKVDASGKEIHDADPEKDKKNTMDGHIYPTSSGIIAFHNDREHKWTVIASSGQRHETVKDLSDPIASGAFHQFQKDLIKDQYSALQGHIGDLPVGPVWKLGLDDIIKNKTRPAQERLAASIIKSVLGNDYWYLSDSNYDLPQFESNIAKLSPKDEADDSANSMIAKKKNIHETES